MKNYLFLALFASFALFIIACQATNMPDHEVLFQQTIATKVEPKVAVKTNINQYDRSRSVPFLYYVVNKSNETLYFQDQTMGARIYRYDSNSNVWSSWSSLLEPSSPRPVAISPGTSNISNPGQLLAEDFPGIGTYRLVVYGWQSPEDSSNSKFVAYTDFEVIN